MENIATPTFEVLVFKTAVTSDVELTQIASLLNNDIRIVRWNVDREDVDHVLRIESNELTIFEIIQMLNGAGIFCEELND